MITITRGKSTFKLRTKQALMLEKMSNGGSFSLSDNARIVARQLHRMGLARTRFVRAGSFGIVWEATFLGRQVAKRMNQLLW